MTEQTAPAESGSAMKPSGAAVRLSWLIAALSLVATLVGLFWPRGDGTYSFTSVRGETIDMYGQGLYQYDTLFTGAANKGADVITLLLGLPLLIVSTTLYRRSSLRGGLLLMGAFTWFLYVYASAALGTVAFNNLFLVSVMLFAASLFALVLTYRSFDRDHLSSHFSLTMPRRGLATFLLISGVATLAIWLIEPLTALIDGGTPASLRTQTTLFTHALDMALIVPLCVLAARLIRQRDAEGYLIAVPLLVLEAILAPMIVAQTVSQLMAGIDFTAAEMVGPIAGFVVLALVAVWMILTILRNVSPAQVRTIPTPA